MKNSIQSLLIATLALLGTTQGQEKAAEAKVIPGLSIYPKGDVFPFMGYSGVAAKDAKNGFNVTGPDYGTQFYKKQEVRQNRLGLIREAGIPAPFFVGMNMHFHHRDKYKPYTAEQIEEEITKQVKSLVNEPLLCWWYVGPEEIRHWKKNELEYLKVVTETIRKHDPLKRPIWMYEPNHRTSAALVKTGQYQDIIGKGCYTNLAGYQNDRIWVKWSIEQEVKAIEELSKKDDRVRIPLMMPELCADPKDPADDAKIPTWVRHDCYLGLASGAKGVAIWSLFKRKAVRRTHQIWYDAYAEVGKELTGDLDLGRVFLFGKESKEIKVVQTSGPKLVKLFTGDRTKLELGTSTKKELEGATHHYQALNVALLDYKGSAYAFIVNSHAKESIKVSIQSKKSLVSLPGSKPFIAKETTLAPYQVLILKSQ